MMTGKVGLIAGLGLLALHGTAMAQLGTPTEEEAQLGRPGVATVGNETPPNPDMRDFSGMWKMAPRVRSAAPEQSLEPGTPADSAPQPSNPYRDASRYCIPGTTLLASVEGGTQIMQSRDRITTVTEEHHNIRRIYIDQEHSDPVVRSVNGDSIAHWDGDALVIETIGLQRYGLSPSLVRTERWTKEDGGRILVIEAAYSDESGLPTPRSSTARFEWKPGTRVLEYICEEVSTEYWTEEYK